MYAAQGHNHDVINAALYGTTLDVQDVTARLQTITELKNTSGFPSLLMAAKRTYNILTKSAPGQVNRALFAEPAEEALHAAREGISRRLAERDFTALFELEGPINEFFDRVLVMDKDDSIRSNRLALLQSVKNAFDALGDFSKILE
jgi:glycyl-tRNA synthetase beta chain